jgi:hypothetical protein
VKDQSSRDAQKVSQSFHHIPVQIQQLRQENKELRESLAIKKNHGRCDGPLDLQPCQEYHGDAAIRSPQKIREARARESVREREEKELLLQKAERAKLKEVAQLYKLKLAEERRVVREAAKLVRETEKADRAEKAAQRARD